MEYFKCPKCNGTGEVKNLFSKFLKNLCPRCIGSGKLDWIERIVGKELSINRRGTLSTGPK